jgi:hypothetical protein
MVFLLFFQRLKLEPVLKARAFLTARSKFHRSYKLTNAILGMRDDH